MRATLSRTSIVFIAVSKALARMCSNTAKSLIYQMQETLVTLRQFAGKEGRFTPAFIPRLQ
jgi:hypothetical protein